MNSTYTQIKKEIFKYVMASGSFTIPAIADITGYSTTAISQYVSHMKDEGLIEAKALEKSAKRGRRAALYGISSGRFHFIGVDIKPYCLTIGIADFTGKPFETALIRDFKFENTHENLDKLCSEVENFIDRSQTDRADIAAINFNIGGRVDAKTGTSASIYNFEETRNIPLTDILSERFGTEVFIENDTKAMAYGEYSTCGHPEWKNVLFVNAGSGLGLGIIIDGEIYYGSSGYSGELGHIPVYDNNILCHCGKKGCIETEVSGAAIVRKLMERIRSGESSCLSGKVRRNEGMTPEDIIAAVGHEDPLCIELLSRAGRDLGRHLAGMINIFNPDCIIIGGKLASAPSYYFQQHIALAIKQYSLNLMSQNMVIAKSELGDDAGVVGACLIARNRFFFK